MQATEGQKGPTAFQAPGNHRSTKAARCLRSNAGAQLSRLLCFASTGRWCMEPTRLANAQDGAAWLPGIARTLELVAVQLQASQGKEGALASPRAWQ